MWHIKTSEITSTRTRHNVAAALHVARQVSAAWSVVNATPFSEAAKNMVVLAATGHWLSERGYPVQMYLNELNNGCEYTWLSVSGYSMNLSGQSGQREMAAAAMKLESAGSLSPVLQSSRRTVPLWEPSWLDGIKDGKALFDGCRNCLNATLSLPVERESDLSTREIDGLIRATLHPHKEPRLRRPPSKKARNNRRKRGQPTATRSEEPEDSPHP